MWVSFPICVPFIPMTGERKAEGNGVRVGGPVYSLVRVTTHCVHVYVPVYMSTCMSVLCLCVYVCVHVCCVSVGSVSICVCCVSICMTCEKPMGVGYMCVCV